MAGKLPVILQTEMTECGLACLAMIARYHGHDIDLNVLRRKHLVSMTGASLKSVIAIADGLRSRRNLILLPYRRGYGRVFLCFGTSWWVSNGPLRRR